MARPWEDNDVVGRRPWEDDDVVGEVPWEDADVVLPIAVDSDEDADEGPASLYITFMIDLLICRTLNARQFCVAMFYAGQAGLTVAVQYGLKPGASSGHYQRHVRRSVGVVFGKDCPLYTLDVPGR